jgi:O-antigen/teichoic acid export membrane protein
MQLTGNRLVTLLLEIFVGLAVAVAIILYAAIGPFPWMPSVRWWSLAGTTAIVFWVAVKQYRRYWRRFSFWLNVSGLLAIHVLIYTLVLLRVPEWRLLWFVPPSVVEAGLLVLILHKLVEHSHRTTGG